MLIAKNIHKRYPHQEILKGVNLSVKPGEISILIGPSGSGKTTLLKTLAFLDPPDEGEIHIDERSYRFPLPSGSPNPAPWPELTVVFQQLFLWPHLTLRNNILLPLKLQRPAFLKENESIVEELVERFGMSHFIDRFPNQASLGQRQRVAIARAIALKPKYILMDEITSSLDIEQIGIILEALSDLKSQGIGILIITHLLSFASRAGDQIFFLENGVIGESGDKTMLAHPQTERLQKFLKLVELVS